MCALVLLTAVMRVTAKHAVVTPFTSLVSLSGADYMTAVSRVL